ncbi:MAG: VWA domain-containing protein [bacterium]|nr:VWA domain-containing protein [bacterium]
MSFLQPELLFLLLLVPVAWFVPRRVTDVGHGLLRSVVIAAVVLALARPVTLLDEAEPRYAVVVDQSPSVGVPGARANDFARGLADQLDARIVEIGTAPVRPTDAAVDRALARDGASTPLGTALAAALDMLPAGDPGAIALFTDGLATEDGWGAVVQELTARGVPVHTFQTSRTDDVFPISLETLETLRVGHTARILVEVAGSATDFDVALSGPGGEIERRSTEANGRAAFLFEFEPEEAGFLELSVDLEVRAGTNPLTVNDRLARTFAVQDPLRALYMGGRVRGGAARLAELLGRGFEIDTGAAPTDAGSSLAATYDLVLFDDERADAVPAAFQRELARAVVEDGLGFFMSGGAASFGPGGWHETPLAEVLPVEFQQKEEKRDPSTTLVVIIDTSGSMGGNRVQLAKEVSRLAIRRLLPHDKVGIVEFYGAKHWAAPIQPASNSIELERALNRLDAGGGTVILPAIEEAFYALQNVQTRYKHVLVLTDGGVETGAFESLLRRMAEKGITTSTVLVGPEAHSEFLVSLANWGKGRFYNVPNRFNLPEILLKQPTSAKLPAYRPGTHPVRARGGAGWWGNVDPSAVPPLAGYVETRARPAAQVLLETESEGHPALATWQPGLGRATALMTEPTGAGTEGWRDWDGYGPWLARVLARTAADTREPYAFDVVREGPSAVVTARRLRPGAGPPWLRASLAGGDDGERIEMHVRAEGLYQARVPAGPDDELRFTGGAEDDSGATRLVLAARGESRELQVDPDGALDLERLALATGGTYFTMLPDVRPTLAAGGGSAPARLREWRPACLLLALLFYLIEIYYRRRDVRGGTA